MSFSAYQDYRASGVEWLGEVPAQWSVCALNYRYQIDLGKMLDEKRVTGNHLSPYLRNSDVQWSHINIENLPSMDFSGDDLTRYSLRPGDLLVCEGGEVGRAAVWEGQLDGCFYQKALHRLRPRRAEQDHTRYLLYVFTTAAKRGVFSAGEAKATIAHLPAEMLRRHQVCFPPLDEQVAIAAFLDRETAKIDRLIEEQRRIIALLKEKRQAVISHAVIKGLDPHASMKNSGIEWLGEVPAHWNVSRLKFHLTLLTSGSRGWGDFYADEGPVFVRIGNMTRDTVDLDLGALQRVAIPDDAEGSRTRLEAGDVLFSITADLGSVAVVPTGLGEAYVSQHVALCRLNRDAPASRWIAYQALSMLGKMHFSLQAYGGTKIQLSLSDVATMPVLVPPEAEQNDLLTCLETQIVEYRTLEHEAEVTMQLLRERRAALISAAVTGKIDVRDSAKVLPFPIERSRARALVGTEIIEQSAGQPTFGRVKFQKLAFLAEGCVSISELAGCYTRAAAGPLDGALIEDMERGAHSIAGIAVDQAGGTGTTVSYRLGQQRGAHRQELADWLGPDRTAKLDKLIADLAPLNTKQAEVVATLYGVWNDLLSEGASPSDDEIITGFLDDWHPEKRVKFRASELPDWLGWMRRHGIVPTGSGPKTETGRLFV